MERPLRAEESLLAQTVLAVAELWLGSGFCGGCGTRPQGLLGAPLLTENLHRNEGV
jgi:hypothetical protein